MFPTQPTHLIMTTTGIMDSVVDQLVDTLKVEEGFRSKPYRDSRGFLTIGYGTNISIGITPVEGEILLRERLEITEQRLSKAWGPYQSQPDGIRAALLDMSYQVGIHGFLGFHKMLRDLQKGDYAAAAHEVRSSKWDHETPSRVERVASVFEAQNE